MSFEYEIKTYQVIKALHKLMTMLENQQEGDQEILDIIRQFVEWSEKDTTEKEEI